ncbi:MAG: polygalacturonase [Bacillariaceae sp.]|jgi:polygalacturonase
MKMKKLIPTSTSLQQLLLGIIVLLFLSLIGLCVFLRDDYLTTWTILGVTSSTIASIIQLHVGGDTDPVILNVLDFGAVGDGIADDTAALRRTLHFASIVGGATILFPEYLAFNSGPLNLTSHITLQVDGTLQALDWTTTDWPQIPPLATYGNSRDGPYLQYQAFIYASHASSIRIVGIGMIDGNGQEWWDAFENDRSILKAGRPNLIQLLDCHQVEISGVTLIDSPFWCLHPVLCTDVHIHHIKIRSHMYAPNSGNNNVS